jgi:membrane protease YdiL (CAAX protease family)
VKLSLLHVCTRWLAFLLLISSLVGAEDSEQAALARDEAALVIARLEAGEWQACRTAFEINNRLATSKAPENSKLADRIIESCVVAIQGGFAALPSSPEQRQELLEYADHLAGSLFMKPTKSEAQRIQLITDAWGKALPDDPRLRVRLLGLHIVRKDRQAQIDLAGEIMEDQRLRESDRDWARGACINALLRGKTSEEDLQEAEMIVNAWLERAPADVQANQGRLQILREREQWDEQFKLATKLLESPSLTEAEQKWIRDRRIEGAAKSGKVQELKRDDWMFMLDRMGLGKNSRVRRLIEENGQLLVGAGLAAGWVWLFIVAFITRCMRGKPPGFWMNTLWATVILYASAVILVPSWLAIGFSLLGVLLLVYACTGERAPLHYLVAPRTGAEARSAGWLGIFGWCCLLFLLIQVFNVGYAWVFERVMGRALDSQLVAKLLQHDTLLGLAGAVLAGGLFVPFLEEVVFRGMLQDWWGRRLPVVACVAAVSIAFALIHGLEVAIPIAFIGMLLSMLRIRYRSLWPAVMLHSLNNSAAVIALFFGLG